MLWSNCLFAQTWEASPPADHHLAVVKVISEYGSGSGCVVEKLYESNTEKSKGYVGVIMTAAHVVLKDGEIIDLFSIEFNNGKKSKNASVLVVSQDFIDKGMAVNDVAFIKAWIPEDVIPIEITYDSPKPGDNVEICGFAEGNFRHWYAPFAGQNSDLVHVSGLRTVFTWPIPGDSGGAILYNGKVLGPVSGGAFWIEERTLNGTRITCPLNFCSKNQVKDLVQKLREKINTVPK